MLRLGSNKEILEQFAL